MPDRHHENGNRAARAEELRRAWFDGWTEGVIWTLAKTVGVLREAGHPDAVGRSIVEHVLPGYGPAEGEGEAEVRA
ncbi:MAG: hypothetical protein OXI12_04420 [Gammaproteobacteria bacterium]|nr:hypothetical protein [Gammaproteobacteria bacterium]